ncbi:hypothetical protein [Calothrix sp. NIES-2100]|uniref:hypothetical protein n=1 Tax=Calothrix sp. NIES-2100 TaxID=1954172 RepID=UPI000BBB721D
MRSANPGKGKSIKNRSRRRNASSKAQVEALKNYTGYDPEFVHVDKIYRTRENRAWSHWFPVKIAWQAIALIYHS